MTTKDLSFFAVIMLILLNMVCIGLYYNIVIEEIKYTQNLIIDANVTKNVEILSEDNPAYHIESKDYSDYDLELLARTIYHEAGSDEILDEHQQLVAAVVMTRVENKNFPNAIYDVIMDDKYGIQYSTRYDIVSDSQPEIPQRCYDNALAVLNKEIDYPSDLIYQANFNQGYETWKTFETSYSTTYFCRG